VGRDVAVASSFVVGGARDARVAATVRAVPRWSRRLFIAAGAAFGLTVAVGLYLPREMRQEVWASELEADRATLAGVLSNVAVPPRDAADLAALDTLARGVLLRGDYVRVKVWTPDGTIAYSDDAALIGRRFPVEGGLRTALAGRAWEEVSRLDRAENRTERSLAQRVLEAYFPVERGGDVVAVWEVYRSLDRFDAAMGRLRRAVWTSVGTALVVLFVVLAVLVASLVKALRRRGTEAVALSTQLGTLLAVATETAHSLDRDELARIAVRVIHEEGGFAGVALLRVGDDRHVIASSTTANASCECLVHGVVGITRHGDECTTLGVEVDVARDDLVLVACRPTPGTVTPADVVVLRAAADTVGKAWDNARLYEGLAAAEASQRRLTRQLVHAHEEERRAIVGEIHDGLGQTLHRVLFGLRRIGRTSPDDEEEVARLEGLVESSIGELRLLLRRLRPTVLEDLGLVPALRSLAATATDGGELAVALRTDDIPTLGIDTGLAVYRITQEALHNAVKHGHAGHATVDVTVSDHTLVARIEDDGVGYTPTGSDGLGVWLMRERAEAVGGRLAIFPVASGTAVEARIPIGAVTA
jgi:signal transduction histidine kinase